MSTNTKNKKPAAIAGKSPEKEEAAQTAPNEADKKAAAAEAKKAEKAEAKAKRDADAKLKKEERAAERAAKKANKPAREQPAHMAKVNKFELSLPTPSDEVKDLLESARALSGGDLNVLASWISLEARKRATASSNGQNLMIGDRVRITSGNQTKFIGKEGTVSRSNRIRCFVDVPGFDKPVYLFSGDVQVIQKAPTSVPTQIDLNEDVTTDKAANG